MHAYCLTVPFHHIF
ncbi:hypothetical protein [Paenibacillus hunanensis]